MNSRCSSEVISVCIYRHTYNIFVRSGDRTGPETRWLVDQLICHSIPTQLAGLLFSDLFVADDSVVKCNQPKDQLNLNSYIIKYLYTVRLAKPAAYLGFHLPNPLSHTLSSYSVVD